MALSRELRIAAQRAALALLGAGAALGLWLLTDIWAEPGLPPALYLALFTFLAVQSSVALALAGPIPIPRALTGALVSALPITALVSLAGQRNTVATDLLDDPVMLTVAAMLVLFSTPFLSVWIVERRNWRRYEALFETAWTITMRYAVAWGFVAVFWLVAYLSNELLALVDIDIVDLVLRTDWVRFALTGAVLGLGLAVVYELRETVSPFLFLRLLRLLVPVVLAVVTVFLVAAPLRGLSRLFGEFSSAGLLMGAAIVSITLISTALDRSRAEEVSTPGLRAATRMLALILPLLTGLAVWAVALRVRQYGWTPDRVLAAGVALFLLAYGIGYCGAVLGRRGWTGRIRAVNVAMALAVIGASALWMTPLLNAYRIATASQIGRFESGRATLDQLPLWELAHDWGKAGQAGLARLEAMTGHPDHAELVQRIATVRTRANPFQYEQAIAGRSAPHRAVELAALMAVRPEGAALAPEVFADLPSFRLDQWLEGCQRPLPDGRPGCVLVRGAFAPVGAAELQGIVLHLDAAGGARANFLLLREGAPPVVREVYDPVGDTWPVLPAEVVTEALEGGFEIRPSGGNALWIGGAVLEPGN